jgi:hypothetical protein
MELQVSNKQLNDVFRGQEFGERLGIVMDTHNARRKENNAVAQMQVKEEEDKSTATDTVGGRTWWSK